MIMETGLKKIHSRRTTGRFSCAWRRSTVLLLYVPVAVHMCQ